MSTIFENVLRAMSHKKSDAATAEKLGMSLREYQSVKNEIRQMQKEEDENESLVDLTKEMFTTGYTEDLEKGRAEYKIQTSFEPRTAEEIESLIKLDKTKWKLARYSVWNGGREDVWLTSAKVVAIADESNPTQQFEEFLKTYNSSYKPLNFTVNRTDEGGDDNRNCALIPMPDFHLDKLTVTGTPIKEHIENYNRILDALIWRASKSFNLDEIIFLVGNDFFHTDSIHNTTTKGTPLFVSTEWDNAYELGFDLMVNSIMKLKKFCNKLNIILIPGNHSVTKEFYLAHALEVYFKPDKNIVFNRTKDDQKIYKYGETLLCFSHGNNVNDKLPLVFATQFYKEWGTCRYHEIILGDKHYNSEKLFRSQNEANGVRMRIIPSLSGTDQWHKDNLFVGAIQAGICLIYNEKYGKCAEIEERL